MKETATASELNRYRQAADVAYRYAKNKIERDKEPSLNKEEDPFKTEDKEESR